MEHPLPEIGDVLLVNFDPTIGREQAGRRPAVVVSKAAYHGISPYVLVCPITRNTGSWPFKVILPSGGAVVGAVLVDQIRSIDRTGRVLRHLGRITAESVAEIRAKLVILLGFAL